MTSLDDLLSQEDEHRRERTWLGRNVRRGLVAAAVSAAFAGGAVLALDLVGYDLAYPLGFAGFFTLAVLFLATRALRVSRPDRLGGRPEAPADEPAPDGLALAARRWQARLTDSSGAGRAALAELVDARLWRRHGLTRDSDPARARELLGGRLWTYLTDPDARTPSVREMATILTTVERL